MKRLRYLILGSLLGAVIDSLVSPETRVPIIGGPVAFLVGFQLIGGKTL